jgi:hypothetical protein
MLRFRAGHIYSRIQVLGGFLTVQDLVRQVDGYLTAEFVLIF